MLRIFQDSFICEKATSSHFFRVTAPTQQLLFQSRYFFRASASFEELLFQNSHFFRTSYFFQNSYFSRAKLLPSSHVLRIGSSLGQLHFGTATFFVEEFFRIKISTEELLFPSRCFWIASTFSEKLHFGKS